MRGTGSGVTDLDCSHYAGIALKQGGPSLPCPLCTQGRLLQNDCPGGSAFAPLLADLHAQILCYVWTGLYGPTCVKASVPHIFSGMQPIEYLMPMKFEICSPQRLAKFFMLPAKCCAAFARLNALMLLMSAELLQN